jgi:enoyl-CoA hydratase/carnithine racemase
VTVHFSGERVRVVGKGSYRELWLTRPDARNALDTTMRDELFESLGGLTLDRTVTAVALLAEGPDFSAGGDLDEFGTSRDVVVASQIRLARSLPLLFHVLSPRLTAGIQGVAVGAGIELPAFAKTVVASTDARMRLPELAMGVIPGSGGTVSIPRRVGAALTLELMLSGRWMGATEAHEQGLVDEVVDREELVGRVRELAAA